MKKQNSEVIAYYKKLNFNNNLKMQRSLSHFMIVVLVNQFLLNLKEKVFKNLFMMQLFMNGLPLIKMKLSRKISIFKMAV